MLTAWLLAIEAPPSIDQAIATAMHACAAPSSSAEITVCGRDTPERGRSRFRIPYEDKGFDPDGPIDSVSRERHRLIDADGAAPDGTRGSCSAVGQDGFTGCTIRDWRKQDEQHGRY